MHTLCLFATMFFVPGTVGPDTDQDQSSRPARLVSQQQEDHLRSSLPKVDDPAVQRMLDDPTLILYTDREMPRAYQFWSGDLQGVHLASYNISAGDGEPFGNGNREFPWGAPAGTHRTKNVSSFRFLWLPRDEDGKPLPVVWHRKRLPGDSSTGYAWLFPVGTVVGEVLLMRGPDDIRCTFEMRTRTRESDSWGVDVFRPFPRAVDLAERIKQLRPNWQENESLVALCRHLEEPVEFDTHTLSDRQPGRRTFSQSAGIDNLPELTDNQLVSELLTKTVFRSALGGHWKMDASGNKAFAPTTTAAFHIVPANYDAGFVEVDRQSCMRCHETVNQSVDRFDSLREWYGRIRGSDGIFSFHPFSLDSLSDNGFGRSIQMRKELVDGGVLEEFDPALHRNSVYPTIEDLVQ